MSAWLDGLSVLGGEWRLVGTTLVCVLAGQVWVAWALKKAWDGRLDWDESLSLGLAGWPIPVFLLALLWRISGLDGLFWILPAAPLLLLLPRLKPDLKPAPSRSGLFLLLFLVATLPLRLAYASRATFPLYFDSAQHYSLIQGLLNSGPSLPAYYHLGYHLNAAFIASVSGAEITRTMLALGQFSLLTIPFPLYCLVRRVTGSVPAGWFALLLAAFGWYMPAHAADWGKYPALASMGLIPFVLCLANLLFQQKSGFSAKMRWILYGMLGISATTTIFTHSRSLVVLGIVFLAWTIVIRLEKLPRRAMVLAFILIVVVAVAQVIFILRQNILALLVDPYLNKGVLVTVLVLALSVFAWMAYPRLTFVSVLTMTFMLAGLFIPVTFLPGYPGLTLLDRPYVEMILFLPLSLLGGLGLAGLAKRFPWGKYAGLLAIGIVAVNAFFTYDLYPSNCCVIVGNDDVAAMDWVTDQLPVDARIGISSTQMKVISERPEGDAGADAGIWLAPLTGRTTIPLPNTSAFDQEPVLINLCGLEIDYLFVGEIGQPFNTAGILARPEWYRPLLSMPKTGVYEVIGCND